MILRGSFQPSESRSASRDSPNETGDGPGTSLRAGTPQPSRGLPSRRGSYLLLGLLALVWGVHWPIVKLGLEQVPPWTYASLRLGSALVVVLLVLGWREDLRRPMRGDLSVLLVIGIGQIGAAIILMNLALQIVPPGRSSILAYTTPFWAATVQALVLGMALGRREIAGIAVGLLGIAILLNPTALDWHGAGQLAGSGALVGSAAITAVSVIVVRRHNWVATPLQLLPWQLLVALVPITVIAFVAEGGTPIHPGSIAAVCVLYSGVLATAFAYWASQVVSGALPPTVTTVGMLATPVAGLLASSVLVQERVTPADLVGFAVTAIGIGIVALGDARESPPRGIT